MAKSVRRPTRRADAVIAVAADRPSRPPRPTTVTNDDIARRAYDLHLARGGEHGHDQGDWLQAEQELRARSTTA
jgi:hypothetical protein